MQAKNYKWKFELPTGKMVFEPTQKCKDFGKCLSKKIFKKLKYKDMYFHYKSGGHVAAVRCHLKNEFFIKFDIQDYFPSIHKNRISKRLIKLLNIDFRTAFNHAAFSTVKHPTNGKFVLPYGFVQSSALATLDLEFSLLGQTLDELQREGFIVSIYADDIIISCNCCSSLKAASTKVQTAFKSAEYQINIPKSKMTPQSEIQIFNIDLKHQDMRISDKRMQEFQDKIQGMNKDEGKNYANNINGYLKTVNKNQIIEIN